VTVKVNGIAEDTIKNVEDIQGGSANDTLVGDSLGNRLSGLGGKDALDGRLGNDTLTGGAGADAFRFTTSLAASNVDVITDFSRADDIIQLENAIFTALGSWGASKFLSVASGHAALTKAQRIIYDRADGSLWYDSDGSAHGHSAIKFAVLTTHPKHLDYTDFAII
jgi:Ca2+-binding RTX toxin-like protein